MLSQRPYSMVVGGPYSKPNGDFLTTPSGPFLTDDYSSSKTPNISLVKELKR